MLSRLLYWLIDRLADFLGGLNPARAKKIEAMKVEGARLDALAKEAEGQYKAAEASRRQWEQQTLESVAKQAALRTEFEASEKVITMLEDEIVAIQKRAKELNATVRSRSDDDVFNHAPRTNL